MATWESCYSLYDYTPSAVSQSPQRNKVGCIKTLIILSVAAFHLPVMLWSKGTDDFVTDSVHFQVFLEKSRLLPVSGKAVGKFSPVVCLNTLDRTWECLHQMIHKLSGRIGVVLLECLHEMPARILVNSRVLEKLFSDDLVFFRQADGTNFTSTWIVHLFIGLRDVLRVRRMYSHDPLFFEETVESGNRAGTTALPEFNPENNQSGMRIPAAHITDQLDFIISVLIRMVMRSARTISERVPHEPS